MLIGSHIRKVRKFLSVIPHDALTEAVLLVAAYTEVLSAMSRKRQEEAVKNSGRSPLLLQALLSIEQGLNDPDRVLEAQLSEKRVVGRNAERIRQMWQDVRNLCSEKQVIFSAALSGKKAKQAFSDAFSMEALSREVNYNPHWGAMGAGRLPVPGSKSGLCPLPVWLSPFFGRWVAERLLKGFEARKSRSIEIWEFGPGGGHLTHDILAAFDHFQQAAQREGNHARLQLLRDIRYHAVEISSRAMEEQKERNRSWIERGVLHLVSRDVEAYLKSVPLHSFGGTVLTHDFFDGLPFEWFDVSAGQVRQVLSFPVIPQELINRLPEDVLGASGLSRTMVEKESRRLKKNYALSFPPGPQRIVFSRAHYLALRHALSSRSFREWEGELVTRTRIVELLCEVDVKNAPGAERMIAEGGKGHSRIVTIPALERVMRLLGRAMAPSAEILSFEEVRALSDTHLKQQLAMHPAVFGGDRDPYILLGELLLWPSVNMETWQSAADAQGFSMAGNELLGALDTESTLDDEACKKAVLRNIRETALRVFGLQLKGDALSREFSRVVGSFTQARTMRMITLSKD